MKKRIVVKVGSNVLTHSHKLNVTRLSALVDQIAWLRAHEYEVILVSSGAVACGRQEINLDHPIDAVAQRQLFSALGQTKLIGLYYDLFREYGLHVGQVLTMKECFSSRSQYLNQRSCMEVMLQNDVIPIVNENDTVSVTELMFTDNDELAGLIATMMGAETLVILSNIDGIYTGLPGNPASRLIPIVGPGHDLSEYIKTEKSGFGRGGMLTKSSIARKVADEGIRVIIANGLTDHILIRLAEEPENVAHTEFIPNESPASGVKKWIAHSGSFAKGVLRVNAQAAQALRGQNAVSLLMVGVTAVEGDFEEGDIVTILDENGQTIGVGRSDYSSKTAQQLIGAHDVKPIVHYNYLYVER